MTTDQPRDTATINLITTWSCAGHKDNTYLNTSCKGNQLHHDILIEFHISLRQVQILLRPHICDKPNYLLFLKTCMFTEIIASDENELRTRNKHTNLLVQSESQNSLDHCIIMIQKPKRELQMTRKQTTHLILLDQNQNRLNIIFNFI